jgi:DNA-binding NtrC family response regulator
MADDDHELPTNQFPHPRDEGKPAYFVAVVTGRRVGFQQKFDGRELRIGKDPGNHLCIPDPTVSRFHCIIERNARGLLLRDLNSTNGTRMGGHWIERAYLAPNVPFTIGQTTLQILPANAAQPARAAGAALGHARLVGSSPAISRLLASLPRVASSSVIVLIEGETGTGKTLLAELIHDAGPRPEGPFVVVDCGAIPPTLIESELFGHERGSFTGATERRIGAFEAAQGGTLFLDEIGELPLGLQPKLLRAIEERTIKRVGSQKTIQIDARIITATNRDLHAAVVAGDFRGDLYYRLEAIRLRMPPLRERLEDVPLLIEQFARRLQPGITVQALEELQRQLKQRQIWPGNVRELRNAIDKFLVLGDLGSDVTASAPLPGSLAAPAAFDGTVSFKAAKEEAVAAWEQAYLASLLRHAHGNLSQAARVVQMDRSHLRDLLRRHRLASGAGADDLGGRTPGSS